RDIQLEQTFLGPISIPPRFVSRHLREWKESIDDRGVQVPSGIESVKPTFGNVKPSHETYALWGRVQWDERVFGGGEAEGVRRGEWVPKNSRGCAVPPVLSREKGRLEPVDDKRRVRPWTSPEGFVFPRVEENEGTRPGGKLRRGLAFREVVKYPEQRKVVMAAVARGAEAIRVRN
ncbi:hypothetical protein HK097_003694, partial [Rhizophlyctis rosea]